MISCPDITFLRLDLHEHTKTGANPSKAPILSILFRGIIVETAKLSREWRAWRPTDEIVGLPQPVPHMLGLYD